MATELAFEPLEAVRRNPRADATPARAQERVARDAIADRPAIPLPIGAGDPAVGVTGPPPFRVVALRRRHGVAPGLVETAIVGVMLVLLLAVVASVFAQIAGGALSASDPAPHATAAATLASPKVTVREIEWIPVAGGG